MRNEQRAALTRAIWKERFRSIPWIAWPAFVLVAAISAYQLDIPRATGHSRATVLYIRHLQGRVRETAPYLIVRAENGAQLQVRVDDFPRFQPGDGICIQLWRGLLFDKRDATLAPDEDCLPD